MDLNENETKKPLEKIAKENCSLNKNGQFGISAYDMLTKGETIDTSEAVRSHLGDLNIYCNTRKY